MTSELQRHAELALDLADDGLVVGRAAGQERDLREALAAREARIGEQRAGGLRVVVGQDVAIAPPRDARRDHRRRDRRRSSDTDRNAIRRQSTAAGEGPPDADVVERRPARIEPVEVGRQRRHLAQLRAEDRVVGDPGRIELGDADVVELALLEGVDAARRRRDR